MFWLYSLNWSLDFQLWTGDVVLVEWTRAGGCSGLVRDKRSGRCILLFVYIPPPSGHICMGCANHWIFTPYKIPGQLLGKIYCVFIEYNLWMHKALAIWEDNYFINQNCHVLRKKVQYMPLWSVCIQNQLHGNQSPHSQTISIYVLWNYILT